MSSSFSANQYDSAFKSQRLQNWCLTKPVKERPRAHLGHTTFLADNRGHLLPGVKKGSAWPDFKGTWDLPTRIPAHHINTTARSAEGLDRLQSWGLSPPQQDKSVPQRGRRSTDVGKQLSLCVSLHCFDSLGTRGCLSLVWELRQGKQSRLSCTDCMASSSAARDIMKYSYAPKGQSAPEALFY